MRIIAGTLRRRPLAVPEGLGVRPSTDRVRESIFNLLAHRLPLRGITALDLFAGTGALGLETISRGARHVTFVEHDARILAAARLNAAALGVVQQCLFLRLDAVRYLQRLQSGDFSVIFADPPYSLPSMDALPDMALVHLAPRGLFVLEHDKRIRFDGHSHLDCSRPYGRTIVSIFTSTPD